MEPTRRTQTLVFVALLGLSALTLGLSFAPLGAAAAPVALAIAAAKAVLIGLFFMHLVEQRSANAITAVVAVVLVALFIGIAAGEVATREHGPEARPVPMRDGVGAPRRAARHVDCRYPGHEEVPCDRYAREARTGRRTVSAVWRCCAGRQPPLSSWQGSAHSSSR